MSIQAMYGCVIRNQGLGTSVFGFGGRLTFQIVRFGLGFV